MFKLDLEKAEEPEVKLPTSAGSLKKQESSRKSIYFCFIDYGNTFDCVDHNKLWKILQETGIPNQLTCLLRNLYAGQEATVRTEHGPIDWFQIGKGVRQGCILSPCLFNLYAVYVMWNVRLDESQAGIKIAGRNINNLRFRWYYPNGRKVVSSMQMTYLKLLIFLPAILIPAVCFCQPSISHDVLCI